MKKLVGGYVFRDQEDDYYSRVPEDFINVEEKTITCHSDDSNDSTLKLTFLDNQIKVSLTRDTKRPARVMIYNRESMYADYYRDFKRFYKAMYDIAPENEIGEDSYQKVKNS